jgi:hypothetical protein
MRVDADRAEGATAWAIAPGALRRLAPVFAAGMFAGLAGGLGARIVMRLSAMAAPEAVHGFQTEAGATIGEITREGTLFLLLAVGIGSALVGTAFYLAVRAWLPTRRWVRAVAFGGLELAVFGTVVLDAGNRDFTIVAHPVLNVAMFCGLFIAHGMLLVLWQRPCRRLVAAVGGGVRWREILVNVATIGATGLTLLAVVMIFLRGGDWWQPVVIATLLACAAGLATIDPAKARPMTRPALRAIGGLALGAVALAGTFALLDAVATIA